MTPRRSHDVVTVVRLRSIAPEHLGQPPATDATLLRLLSDLPITVRRSGLTLLLITRPGMASALSQAIDESTFQLQEGTLAGENTVLVVARDAKTAAALRKKLLALLV